MANCLSIRLPIVYHLSLLSTNVTCILVDQNLYGCHDCSFLYLSFFFFSFLSLSLSLSCVCTSFSKKKQITFSVTLSCVVASRYSIHVPPSLHVKRASIDENVPFSFLSFSRFLPRVFQRIVPLLLPLLFASIKTLLINRDVNSLIVTELRDEPTDGDSRPWKNKRGKNSPRTTERTCDSS